MSKEGRVLRRIASSLIVALLFLSLCVFALNVRSAKAQSEDPIVINPNGTITPSANITTHDNVTYTFTGNNYLPIVVNRSNIIINGNGYTLQSEGSRTGFNCTSQVTDIYNVTIKNTNIKDFYEGIYLLSSSNDTISGNNITSNSGAGVICLSSNYDSVSRNNITNNAQQGLCFSYSSYNNVSGNVFVDDGLWTADSHGNIVTSNTVNGKPLIYLENASNQTVIQAGQVVLVNCNHIRVQNLNLSHTTSGLQLWNTNNTLISDNDAIANNIQGVLLSSCFNDTVSGNNITNSVNGIDWEGGSKDTVFGNNVANNYDGIYLVFSSNNTVSGNSMTSNSDGVYLVGVSNSTISGNKVTQSSSDGVFIRDSSNNTFFHNNFINNAQQVKSDGSPNKWDNEYPSGGNYWSDYRTRYPSASENDNSGVWNTSYVIDSNNTDRYPLMGPFETFGVGTWNAVAYSVDTVSNSTITNVSFNATAKTLSFNVTGTSGTPGFCRVDIPTGFMSGQWTLIVGGTHYSNQTIVQSGNYTYIYFTYTQDAKTVQIQSTSAVPEFQPSMLLPLFMIITLLSAMIIKRKRSPITQVVAVLA